MGNAKNWGPVFDDDLITIEFPPDKKGNLHWVKAKEYITAQDQAAAQNAMDLRMMRDKAKGAKQDETKMGGSGSFQLTLLQRMVKAWSFTKKDGSPLPCDAAHVALLPEHTREFIFAEIAAENTEATEEESQNLPEPTSIISEATELALLN